VLHWRVMMCSVPGCAMSSALTATRNYTTRPMSP